MKRGLVTILCGICLVTNLCAEAFPVFGVDSVSSSFFRDWYQSRDLGHYLDNYNDYVVYETETTGEWNLGDRNVFSIAGNSFRQNKYWWNGMRIDSRMQVGSTMYYVPLDQHSLQLDYHTGELFFTTDSCPTQQIRLTGNMGNLGGVSPGTCELINLFHSSGVERTMDSRPVEMRNHVLGAGTAEATWKASRQGRYYTQHIYGQYGKRMVTAFDQTGIVGLTPRDYATVQLDGELPCSGRVPVDHWRYMLVGSYRNDYFSEFLYNQNEQARLGGMMVAMSVEKNFGKRGTLVAGLSYGLSDLRHDSTSFSRNLFDQDGEAFDPWYTDGRTHELNLSIRYDRPLRSWLSLHVESYNSAFYSRSTPVKSTTRVGVQSIADEAPQMLYSYDWTSGSYAAGLLENSVQLKASHRITPSLQLQAMVGVTLDGILVREHSVVSPNGVARMCLDWRPKKWVEIGLHISHNRQSYTMDEVRYLSPDYLNGEIRYSDGTLLATTGGAYHTPASDLWYKQPSYAVLDIPIRFTFGRERRHQVSLLNSARKYYHQWFTAFRDGVDNNLVEQDGLYYWQEGEKQYVVTTQPLDLMSSTVGGRTPYYLSNVVKYTYSGKKWFVSLSWQSYLMAGLSTLGNGPLHNNIGSLSESSANPNTYLAYRTGNQEYSGNCRLNQDKSFIARIQVTYNACKYFSIGFNGKFKDGQPFSTFMSSSYTSSAGHTQYALFHTDAKGINMHNGAFGKREDAFFNLELRATGRWWVKGLPMSLELLCYNIYDFGTALTEYTFDDVVYPTYDYWTNYRGISTMQDSRTSMSLCIPRGLLLTWRVGLEKEQ